MHMYNVDVMITIFCHFQQFSAKKMSFFFKKCYDSRLQNSAILLSKKRQFFADIFGGNILKL
jgi:hypothetical protein